MGLETCAAMQGCGKCPYSGTRCVIEVSNDALALIQQLKRERDAAVEQLKRNIDSCEYCAKKDTHMTNCPKWQECDKCCGWEWCGVQEQEEKR